MSVYPVVLLVFGIVLTYLWLIRHFWLRHIFREQHKPAAHTRNVMLDGGLAICIRRCILIRPSPPIQPSK
jgi:hypothetical protein